MGKVVVVGLDAMDSTLARSLAESGHMPTLADLLSSGVRAPTRNPEGLLVGGVWPSFATANWPGRHGFYCFRQFEAGTYRIRRFTPSDIAGTPFWSSLSAAGKRCCIVDAPLTTPRPEVGLQVVDWGSHDRMLAPSLVPRELQDGVFDHHGPHPVIGKCDDYARRGDWAGLADALARGAAAKTDLCLDLMERESWDLFLAVYGESHCAGHQFWAIHDPSYPTHDPAVRADHGDLLVDTYRAIDQELCRLLDRVPPETSVVVVLSHGFGPHYDGDHLVAEIVRRLELADAPASPLRRGAEVLARRGDRLVRAVERRRRPEDPRLVGASNVDGGRRFFPIPNNELFAGIRVNLEGREPRGRVRTEDYEDVLEWLSARFLELVDADDGAPLVDRVLRVDCLYEGERRQFLPDLLVDWRRERPIRSAASAVVGEVRGSYLGIRSGDHRPAGLVIARAPGSAPRMLTKAVDIVDVGPTIAAHLGVEIVDVEGRPVPELLAAEPSAAGATGQR